VLQEPGGRIWLQASDIEPDASGERLELLTVVRALESLDQPSHITLNSAVPYVRRGLRFGIPEWRASNWQWERFGVMVPVKDEDLWRRFDRTMRFHSLKFSRLRFDSAHTSLSGPKRRPAVALATRKSGWCAEGSGSGPLVRLGMSRSSSMA
jgi:ribonuclease HI